MRAPWLFRAAWLVVPFLVGPALAAALDDSSSPGRTIVSVALWAVWALTMLATLVPRTFTLTLVRVVAPATLLVTVWATIDAGFDANAAVGLIGAGAVAVLVFDPALGEVFVNGSSYGPELRLPLRPPAAVLLGPLPVAWLVSVLGLAVGPTLLAHELWVAGLLLTGIGAPLAGFALRSLHGLSRRWLVFVPGGLVVHDPLALAEPVLMPTSVVGAVRPAPAHSSDERLDLSGSAPGLAIQIDVDPAVGFGVTQAARHTELIETEIVLVTPSRPNRLVSEAAERLKV
ncbi:MAG: hypothetical protein OES57_04975 [Acidimicrobiia bacterium]|nr:hypothetical protein [Acidimicrobiia bacterium]